MYVGLVRFCGQQVALCTRNKQASQDHIAKEKHHSCQISILNRPNKSDTPLPTDSQHDTLKHKRADQRPMDISIPCVLVHFQAVSGKLGHRSEEKTCSLSDRSKGLQGSSRSVQTARGERPKARGERPKGGPHSGISVNPEDRARIITRPQVGLHKAYNDVKLLNPKRPRATDTPDTS